MQKDVFVLIYATLLVLMSGCSSFKFPGVYRINLQQGNYIEQDMVDNLKVGMTKKQVRYVMGSALVEDTFNADRWDYYFSMKRGSKTFSEKRFTVHFDDDKLVKWEGDIQPSIASSGKDKKEKKEGEGDEKAEPSPQESENQEPDDESTSASASI